MMECINTVAQNAAAEQIIDKSRFIALIAQVKSLDEIEKHMTETKLQYPNARHYVYAYRLNQSRTEKASDDGEPQGTGGRPVLDLLQHRQVWDVQIIVVRYFGGILLGTGGLTRAYGGTARLALDKAGIIELAPNNIYRLKIPYSLYEQVKYGLKQNGWESDNEHFEEQVLLDIFIPKAESSFFESWLADLTNNQVIFEKTGSVLR